MTKLLCFGDLHLGAGADYGAEPGDRLRDQQLVLERIVELANENPVDAVLFAGDAFHRRRPTPAEMLAWSDPLRDLEAPLIAISGNHDVEAADAPIALDVLAHTARLSKRPEVIHIVDGEVCPAYVPGGFSIATLPWVPMSRLVAARDGHESRDRTHEEAAAMLVAAARGLRAEIPAETPAVLLGHWSVSGASTPTGAITDDFREVVLDVDDVNELGFDAVVFGHIHKAADFNGGLGWMDASTGRSGEPFLYTGSPLPVDYGEAKSAHGCWLVTVGGTRAEAEFLPISSRPFVTVDVDLTAERHVEGEETTAVGLAIGIHDIEGAVVKVRYRATEAQVRRINWPALRPLLDDAHKVFSITGDIVRSERARVDGMDEDLAPLVAVDAWLAASGIPEAAAADLVDLSTRYLQEVAG